EGLQQFGRHIHNLRAFSRIPDFFKVVHGKLMRFPEEYNLSVGFCAVLIHYSTAKSPKKV
ncbi:MAG: hypothetical protein IKS83_08985, partial [Victivallales bacterium]|nr:hypothetical protein [Victivallales bacterium]